MLLGGVESTRVVGGTQGFGPGIHLCRLDQIETKILSGAEGGFDPVFSPDGQWLLYWAPGKLKKSL